MSERWVQVKICGIRDEIALAAAVGGGADFVGFNFAPSKRRITVEEAARLARSLPSNGPRAVGVFVNADPEVVRQTARTVGLDVVQLSGDERPEDWLEFEFPIWKSVRPVVDGDWDTYARWHALGARLLVDSHAPGSYGGSGEIGDWELAETIARRFPIFLAGGLTPENVEGGVAAVHPFGVDVASGVETDGTKDPAKIRAFIRRARKGSSMETTVWQVMDRPDDNGRFGSFGGKFVPETLMPALAELEAAFNESLTDETFQTRLNDLLRDYVGRPTPLTFAERLTEHAGGARIYLKREDLAHTGAHKINNALGQALLAGKLGKPRIIAETGAGQHGVATATVCARLGLECVVYMGEEDIRRQSLNVFRMRLLGAEVVPVTSGSKTLKDAINEAIRDWVSNVRTTHYLIGSAVGPHPYPWIVREYQAVIGREARRQVLAETGSLPDAVIACVGGGSNAIGMFYPFAGDLSVRLIGVEAAGSGIESGKHAATLSAGTPGVLHGAKSYLLQDDWGQVIETHSISAGLDYPGVGPEHAFFKETGRAEYRAATDTDALEGFQLLCRTEGIIPALEPAHAVLTAVETARRLPPTSSIILNLSGRGDKDMLTVAAALGITLET